MDKTQQLLTRLDEIGQSLDQTAHALALIGLGSVGIELDRLDAYSDLDFFVIVAAGHKATYLQSLDWLAHVCPIAYQFRNTPDGYKLLFQDSIFCEFAVFEPDELHQVPFAPGRVIWKQPHITNTIAIPPQPSPPPAASAIEWQLGEALTNLYVGLGRYRRGEKLSAARFVQQYAVDRVLALAANLEPESRAPKDPFASERRFEQRFPNTARELPHFVQGYERSPESALAILAFLERHFAVNPAIAAAIRALANE